MMAYLPSHHRIPVAVNTETELTFLFFSSKKRIQKNYGFIIDSKTFAAAEFKMTMKD